MKLRRDRRANSHWETPKTQLSNTILSRCFYALFSLVSIVLPRLPFIRFVSENLRLFNPLLLSTFFQQDRSVAEVHCTENPLQSGSIHSPVFTRTFLSYKIIVKRYMEVRYVCHAARIHMSIFIDLCTYLRLARMQKSQKKAPNGFKLSFCQH
jgi:hypothetical protein